MWINKGNVMISHIWRKRLIFVVISAVVGLIISVAIMMFINKPKYEAYSMHYVTVILLDQEKELGYNEFLASNELASSIILYVSDTYMYKLAAKNLPKELSDKYDYKDLQEMIDVVLIPDTFIIKVTATADNKQDAILLSNFYSEFSLIEVKSLLGLGYSEILEEATTYNIKTKSNILIYAIIGAISGAAIMCFLIYLKNKLNEKVKSSNDIRKEFPFIYILGEVEHEKGVVNDL